MKESTLSDLLQFDTPGLMASVKAAPEGFRVLLVSMCSHDLYGGNNTADPNNPNLTAAGSPVTTNGLIATKAAVQYTQAQYPTTKFFLHGTSAGGAGTFAVAWGLQLQGDPPAGRLGLRRDQPDMGSGQQRPGHVRRLPERSHPGRDRRDRRVASTRT